MQERVHVLKVTENPTALVDEGLTWTGALNRWVAEVRAPDEFWLEMRRMAKCADRWNQNLQR
jgi:hypothetical protein